MRYIKWNSLETEPEPFEHFGIFIKETEFYVYMTTKFGEMCILKTNGTITESTQEEYDSVVIEHPPEKEHPTLPKNNESSSKAERARAIYINLHKAGKTRKDIIKEFIDVVGLTKAGAATYYQNISKKVK